MPKNSLNLKSLSVVIPAYNASAWLPKSVPILAKAIKAAELKQVEIIIVDDGSSDDTAKVAKALDVGYPIYVISQPNKGRFLARDTGVKTARYEYILFVDTRIYVGENSLKFISRRLNTKADRIVWTSHVLIDRKGNPYARFWEALTFIAWRKYFANPREYSYGANEFDYYPKGTTCFFAPRDIIQEANKWFLDQSKNEKAPNDDTLLIRRIVETHNINVSPDFYCTYHARTSLKQYCKHVYHRGKVFVDGFLRRDGNRFFWPLVAFLVLSILVPVALVFFSEYILVFLGIILLAWIFELLGALLLGVPHSDAFSFWLLSPLFIVFYGLGIWKAMIEIYILSKGGHRRT